MVFYVWDYFEYLHVLQTGFAEFEATRRKKFGGEFPTCSHCGERLGTLSWQPPFSVKLTTDKPGDLCTDGQDILLSERFRRAWEDAGFSGLEFCADEVSVTSGPGGNILNYRVVRIPYTLVLLDRVESGLVEKKLVGCDRCGVASRETLERIRILPKTLPQLDAFRPSGLYGITLVSERFVELVTEASLTNFHFIHQDDYQEPRKRKDGLNF